MKKKKRSNPTSNSILISLMYLIGIVCVIPFIVTIPFLFDMPNSPHTPATWCFFYSLLLTPLFFLLAIIIGNIKNSRFFLIGLIGPISIFISILSMYITCHGNLVCS